MSEIWAYFGLFNYNFNLSKILKQNQHLRKQLFFQIQQEKHQK